MPQTGAVLWKDWWLATGLELTAPFFDDSADTFYSILIENAVSAQSITVPFHTETNVFYGPTLANASPQTLTAPFLDDSADTFYGPTLANATPQDLVLPYFTNSGTFFSLDVFIPPPPPHVFVPPPWPLRVGGMQSLSLSPPRTGDLLPR